MPAKLIQEKFVSALPGTLVANTLYYVRVGTGFDVYLTNSSGTIVAYPLNAKSPPAETSSGTAIQFDRKRHYGQTTALTGNMTLNATGAVDGAEVIIRHNQASAPTVPMEWKKLAGSYVNSVDNTYIVVRFSSTIYYYTISQVEA